MKTLLDELYAIKKKDFIRTGQVFGEAFKNDPAFYDFFKDLPNERRDAFFEGLAAWLPGEYADMTFLRILCSGLIQSSRRAGMKTMLEMKPVFEPLENARREHMKGLQYIYLMTLGVNPSYQGKGFGG